MDLEKIFKRIVLLDFFSLIAIIMWGIVLGITDVTPVSEEVSFTNTDFLYLTVLFVYFFNLYLLYNFKPIGKKIYLIVLIFSYGVIFLIPIEQLQAKNHFEYLIGSIGPILSGAILTMLYLTDVGKRFDK